MLEATLRELRFAGRALRRRRALTIAAVMTLALGIGANSAIFSLVRAVLLRPLPYSDPDRVVFVANHPNGRPVEHDQHGTLTGANVMEWQNRSTTLESIALIQSWMTNREPRLDVMGTQGAERIRGAFVTPNFFELLGAPAAMGRTFDSGDRQPLAVLSDAFWRRRFAADPSVVGTTIDALQPLTGRVQFTIAGVLPPAFRFTYPLETEVWVLFPWTDVTPTHALDYQMIGRLRSGITSEQASSELTHITRSLYPRGEQVTRAEPMPAHVAEASRPGVMLIAGGAAVVLLIACVNVALLLLASIADRRREIGLRAAVGAGRRHIVRHVLAESVLVSGLGAALGLVLAALGMPLLRRLVPPLIPRGDEVHLDPVVLGVTVLATVATALVSGMAPAWLAQRQSTQTALRHASGTATADRQMTFWRGAIVVTQVSVVCVLLVTAGLLLHSFWRVQQVNLGFDGRDLLTVEMRLMNPKYHQRGQTGRVEEFQRQLMERVRALPGVEQASMTTAIPMSGGTDWMYAIRPIGGTSRSFANMRVVDREFFGVMRIPLIAGRFFTAADDARVPRVAIVSEQYARALFGDGPAVGRYLDLEQDGKAQIVGVVADVRHEDVKKAPNPGLYFPRAQMGSELISLVVRPATRADGASLPAAIRGVIRELDPEQPIDQLGTIAALLGRNTSEERFYTVTTAGFAATAVLLALVGLTGVVGRTVTERLRELALRIALGAEPQRLAIRTIAHAMLPVFAGLAFGVVAARGTSRLAEGLLFDVSPLDPATYVGTVALLIGAALVACYLPARRTLRIEPMSVLKSE